MENYNSYTDLQLFSQITAGNIAALEELYDRYSPLLYTLAKKIVLNDGAAETVLSDVFEIVWRKASAFDSATASPYIWLIGLTRNKAVDHIKGSHQEDAFFVFDGDYENMNIMPRLSPFGQQLELNDALNMQERIRASLDKLTDAQKYVLYLAYYEGYSEQEISGKTRIPLQTIQSKIKTATENLKNNL